MDRGLKCHTLVNLFSSISFYSNRYNDTPIYIGYKYELYGEILIQPT